jgi:hypothetical protein
MSDKRLAPDLTFDPAEAADLLDGLKTLKGISGRGVIIPPPGTGPDQQLSWAMEEISAAARSTSKNEVARHCTGAVMSARRALACLVDWYLDRDFANFCKNRPKEADEKAAFLMSRGLTDELSSRVLRRNIQIRDRAEHHYDPPSLEQAEDFVQLVRREIAVMTDKSKPQLSPWIFGSFLGGVSSSTEGVITAEFHGWSQELVIFSRFGPRPWVGLLIRDTESKATVLQAFLVDTTRDELTQLLSLAEQRYGHRSVFLDRPSCEALARALGLMSER